MAIRMQIELSLQLNPGGYFLSATATLNEVDHRSQEPIVVQENTNEQRSVIATDALLKAIAKSSGGNFRGLKDPMKLQINDTLAQGVSITEYAELINTLIVFALLVLLLAADWYFRSRKGEF